MDKKEKQEDRKTKLLIIFLLILFYLIGVFIGMIIFKEKDTDTTSGSVTFTIDPDSKDPAPQHTEHVPEQGIVICGRETMTIPADQKEAAVDLYNPEENAGLYYLTFELRLYNDKNDDYEVLYRSGLVEPGKHIYLIELSRSLEKGEYKGAVHVQPYCMDKKKSPTNNADMNVKIIAE